MTLHKLSWFSVWLLACGACADDPPPDVPPAKLELATTSTQLDNGLTVVVAPNHAQPLVSAMVTFHAGSFVEDESQSGYSHLLEHMIFEGSSELPDSSEFRQRLRELGAILNGETGRDYVRYYYTLPRESLDAGLELLAQSVRKPQLDSGVLQKEVKVVLSEFDLNDGNFENVQQRRVAELLFDRYPNRADPLGDRDVIEQVSADKLRELHANYYVPNNAQLVLSGDVDPDAALTAAKNTFGDWPRADDPFAKQPVPAHPKLAANVSEAMTAPVTESRVVVAYQGPNRSQDFRASVAADLLAVVVTLPTNTFRDLVTPPIVRSALIRHYVSSHAAVISVEVDIGQGFEINALKNLAGMRARLTAGFTAEQLHTAKDAIWQARLSAAEADLAVASQLSGDWALAPATGSPDYLDTLYSLTRDDLTSLIDRYMIRSHHAAVLLSDPQHMFLGLEAELRQLW